MRLKRYLQEEGEGGSGEGMTEIGSGPSTTTTDIEKFWTQNE